MCKFKTLKLLEDRMGENLADLRFNNDLLDSTAKAQSVKEKIAQLGFVKMKSFCSARDTMEGMKREASVWEPQSLQNTYLLN